MPDQSFVGSTGSVAWPLRTRRSTLRADEDSSRSMTSHGGIYRGGEQDAQGQTTSGQFIEPSTFRAPSVTNGLGISPQILIDDFNKDAQTICPGSSSFHFNTNDIFGPILDASVHLQPGARCDLEDFGYNTSFDDPYTTSPLADTSPVFKSGFENSGGEPMTRDNSYASSRCIDDNTSQANSIISAGSTFGGWQQQQCYMTPSSSYSQDTFPSSAPVPLQNFHPSLRCPWLKCQNGQDLYGSIASSSSSIGAESSPDLDPSQPPVTSTRVEIPRSAPRLSALSEGLANTPPSASSIMSDSTPESSFFDRWGAQYSEREISARLVQDDLMTGTTTSLIPFTHDGIMPTLHFTPVGSQHDHGEDDFSIPPYADHQTDPHSIALHNLAPASASTTGHATLHAHEESHLTVPFQRSLGANRRTKHMPRRKTVSGSQPIPIKDHRPNMARSVPHCESMSGHRRPQAPHRGRRKGPMEEEARRAARRTRNERTICVRCKHFRQKCQRSEEDPEGPCLNCQKSANRPRWPGPCSRACFDDYFHLGGLDYAARNGYKHHSRHGQGFVDNNVLSEHFELGAFLRQLDDIRQRYNFGVYNRGSLVYELDLDRCYDYLLRLQEHLGAHEEHETDFGHFIDDDLLRMEHKSDDWTELFARDTFEPGTEILPLHLILCNFSGQESFLLFEKNGQVAVDIEAEQVQPFFPLGAARLASIIARKVEVEAYTYLQKELLDFTTSHPEWSAERAVPFLHDLGRVLVNLRWQLGQAAVDERIDEASQNMEKWQFVNRVTGLCKILYFYFCFIRRRLGAELEKEQDEQLHGIWSAYNESSEDVWDTFPIMERESPRGFEEWLGQGQAAEPRLNVVNGTQSFYGQMV